MDPLLVDVNVHPTKQEVRLSKEKELTELISNAIQKALSQENLIPSAADNLRFKKKYLISLNRTNRNRFVLRFEEENLKSQVV